MRRALIRCIPVLVLASAMVMPAAAQWTISVNVNPVTCPGGNDGSATVNVTGGQAPYTFQWNDPAGQTTATAVNLLPDTYQVLIVDDSGSDTVVSVVLPGPNFIRFQPSVIPAICNTANGRIKLNTTGGTPPFTYSWAGINTSGPVADDLAHANYHVVAIDNKGCEADTSITVPEGECEIGGEQVFTPNGDGINDTWGLSNIHFFPNSRVVIYNRWGQIVHEQKGVYENWDGTHWGQPLPDATYYYVVYKDMDDKENVTVGNVTIVR
jgi:gliding motility-associated-like protein